ncbi:MAG: MBL fold metallo-hydrolase [Pseudomonadales bacterium]|jgi:glyoxylase-like metal-dependent hydrolase (beta-lactamase superfamily II)
MAHRQEQEVAGTEVTEVAPNVLRMQLPIRMPGLGHVNMYALLDDRGAAVIDPGLPGPWTWQAIQDRLRQADLKPRDVHTVLVTHSHPDHFGGAQRFVKEHGARVVAHRTFRFGLARSIIDNEPEVSVDDLAAARAREHGDEDGDADVADGAGAHDHGTHTHASSMGGWWGGASPWGGRTPGPPISRRLLHGVMRMLGRGMNVPEVTHPVEQGDLIELAGREMFVLHTPGHTPDHFCLHDPEAGVFIAGDHVLPTITPHISGISSSADPLLSFFYSLDRVGELPGITQVLPAHGHPFTDLRGRAEAIKAHHFERLERIRQISREFGRPATVAEFSRRLFRPRSWGAMAESETYAHLEHLRHAGDAECHRDRQGQLLYLAG